MSTQAPHRSRTTLFTLLFDYAGLFPPSGLPLAEALDHYHSYRSHAHRWMLGRFVLTTAHVQDLLHHLNSNAGTLCGEPTTPWDISLLCDNSPASLDVISQLADSKLVRLGSVEVKDTPSPALQSSLPDNCEVFVELPLDANLPSSLDRIAGHGWFAKVRTGGLTPEAFPTATALGQFIRACHQRHIPFKATAGLHHAFYGRRAVGEAMVNMHGFMNLLVAATLCIADKDAPLDEVLTRTSAAAAWDESGLVWDHWKLNAQQLESGRQFFRSFGTCSFTEPTEELEQMGWL